MIKKYFPFIVYIVRGIRTGREFLYKLYYRLKVEKIPYVCVNSFDTSRKKTDKIIIIAPPCVGKSTFAKRKVYKGIKIVDDLHKCWDHKTVYEEFRLSFLREHAGKICALDPFYNIHLESDIRYIAVLSPKEKVVEFYKSRREKAHYACTLKDILKRRRKILSFAIKNRLPIYPSFEAALDDVVKCELESERMEK